MVSLKWPCGISDFYKIRTENFVYVDKTRYIEELEKLHAPYLLFVRPRHFGKSLFLSTLEHYYDLNRKDDFAHLFGDLYIGQHPTERRNKYFILHVDFSGLDISSSVALKHSFYLLFKRAVIQFFATYSIYFKDASTLKSEIEQCDDDLGAMWSVLFGAVERSGYKIYLIIDEYDYFAHDIIAMGKSPFYDKMIHAFGFFVRNFYAVVKIGTGNSVISRIFMTGVSPIILDGLTSGFNIAQNLTMSPIFGEVLGFTEAEVRQMVTQFQPDTELETLMNKLRSNYGGYLFCENGRSKLRHSEEVYNPDAIFYFFHQWSRFGGEFLEQRMKDHVKIDCARLRRLLSNKENRSQMERIIKNERTIAQIGSRFSFDGMYHEKYFVPLLFHMGLLTIRENDYGLTDLCIPNDAIKSLLEKVFQTYP
jgi:hypothetical protein